MLERCYPLGRGQHAWHDGGTNKGYLGTSVLQQIMIMVGCQQRVDKHRNDARPNGAPEQDGKVDGVVQDENDTIFALQAKSHQDRTDPRHAAAQFRVADLACWIDERSLIASAFDHVTVDESNGCVVVALDRQHWTAPDRIQEQSRNRRKRLDLSQKTAPEPTLGR